jgi:hypothetical protein
VKPDDPNAHPVWRGAVDVEIAPGAAEASLDRMLAAARARRRRRLVSRGLAAGATAVVAVTLVFRQAFEFRRAFQKFPESGLVTGAAAPILPPSRLLVGQLSDEALAARLDKTPYAIVGPPGHQRLIVLTDSASDEN